MATNNEGILGGFSGTIGTVVGFVRHGKSYMRSRPVRKAKYTESELMNQAKFKLVQDHLEPIKDLLREGFREYYTQTGGYRAALAYTRKMALVSDDAGFYIDPALFKISGGTLEGAINPTVSLEPDNVLRFNWESAEDGEGAQDQMMVLVYDTANFNALTRVYDGAFRNAGELHIALPASMQGKTVDIYIGFMAADRSRQSESQYLGRVEVAGINSYGL